MEFYDPNDNSLLGKWTTVSDALVFRRVLHTATLLPSGRVLVAGGTADFRDGISIAMLYDPDDNQVFFAGYHVKPRMAHTATLLPSGQVLVAGGYSLDNFPHVTLRSVELYDPATNEWTEVGSLANAREDHTATLLPSGQVLVAGGIGPGLVRLSSAELYDPAATGVWTEVGSLTERRVYHTATLLPSGQVLAAGGRGGAILPFAELYAPATGTWTAVGSLLEAREAHTATLLPSGEVLAVGGLSVFDNPPTSSAELYAPGLDTNRRPQVATFPPTIDYLSAFEISGTGFGGGAEASSVAPNHSAVNFPLVQLRAVEGGASGWLVPGPLPIFCPEMRCSRSPAQACTFHSDCFLGGGTCQIPGFCRDQGATLPVSGLPPIFDPGWHLLTVVTAGVPSESQLVQLECNLAITVQPEDQLAAIDSTATFGDVVARGPLVPVAAVPGRRDHLRRRPPGGDGFDIPGATSTSYTTPLITGPESGTRYRVLVSSPCADDLASDAAVLTVEDAQFPAAAVMSPTGGEFWLLSDPDPGVPANTELVTWSMSDNVRICRVEVSLLASTGGGAFEPVAPGGGLPESFGPGGTCTIPAATTSVEHTVPSSPPSGSAGSLYKVQFKVTDHAGNRTEVESPAPFFIVQPNNDSIETMILAHPARMVSTMGIPPAEADDLTAQLQQLAAHPRVQGRVVDLGGVTSLSTLYADWDAGSATANDVLFAAGGLHEHLRSELLSSFTGVRYLAKLLPESSYTDATTGELTAASTVGQALAADQYLSDDPLAVRDPVALEEVASGLFVPDLAVGRLVVEEPEEIVTVIATFISEDGILDLTAADNAEHQVLVTGYDFLIDAARTIRGRWKGALGLSTPDASPQPVDGVLVSAEWGLGSTAAWRDELLDHLAGRVGHIAGGSDGNRFAVMSLSGHATHFEAGIPGADRFDIQGLAAACLLESGPECLDPPVRPLDLAGGWSTRSAATASCRCRAIPWRTTPSTSPRRCCRGGFWPTSAIPATASCTASPTASVWWRS